MASGDTLLLLHPRAADIVATNGATHDTRNAHPVLDFDGATNESAVWSAVMPQHYAATTGVTVYIHYSSAGTANDVDWDVAFERIGDQQQDVDSDSFAAVNSVDGTTVPGTSGLVDIVNVTFTDGADMDSVATGEKFRMKLTRDAASDTSTDDVELHFIEIRET